MENLTGFKAAKQSGKWQVESGKLNIHKSDKSDKSDKCISKSSQIIILPKQHNVKDLSDLSDLFYLSDFKKKVAFTLAEILITLAVVGVIAAMTLPTVINNLRAHQYQSRFKKVYSNIQQAFMFMKADMGIENLGEYYANANKKEFYARFPSYFRVVKTFPNNYTGFTATNYTNDYTFYSENPSYTCSPFLSNSSTYIILQDGSSFFPYINSGTAYITVDLNGPYKKPNRMGYDIFMFRINPSTDKIEPLKPVIYTDDAFEKLSSVAKTKSYSCSTKRHYSTNGCGCAWHALNDINPDDSSKKYWKSLKW